MLLQLGTGAYVDQRAVKPRCNDASIVHRRFEQGVQEAF